MNIHVVGCGGVASYAVPVLSKLVQYRGGQLTLQDKDVLEERNLERQLFNPRSVGLGKARALADTLRPVKAKVVDAWFTQGQSVVQGTILLGFVDNHRGRKAILDAVDHAPDGSVTAIIAGNGMYCADAYVYRSEWRGTLCDPRVRFPEILTDESGDPTRHCNDEEVLQETGGQTAVANFQAAQYALQLFTAWYLIEGLEDFRGSSPVDIRGNFSKVTVTTLDKQMNGGN
jgi:hypothetical protein